MAVLRSDSFAQSMPGILIEIHRHKSHVMCVGQVGEIGTAAFPSIRPNLYDDLTRELAQ